MYGSNVDGGDEWAPKAAIHFPIQGIKEAMIQ
jgi:hypothetical protein